tara:strand:+ start:343 stop:1098 length:756 start_codon:yes stop_codon:yes gene_type:complete
MDPIQEISEVNVRVENTPSWMYTPPAVPNTYVPVTIRLGFPIVNMPGCVEAHPDNKTQIGPNGLPLDRNLVNDDEAGVKILCPDGQFPSYNPINFEPEQVIPTVAASPPPVAPPPPEIPDTGNIVTDEETPCPGPGQLRVGDVTQSGDERVVGHRLLEDGKTCETLYEPTSVVEKYLPPLNQASTVTSLAIVATAGAAATPLLIRIIKPVVKKIWAKIQKTLGKEVKRPTISERQTNKYREKKGLPPIKRK